MDSRPPAKRLADKYHLERQRWAEKRLLPRARNGDWPAIQGVLLILHEALADHAPLTPAYAEYLSEVLRKIEEGTDPKEAFNIQRKRGERNLRKARGEAVVNAYRIEYQRMQNGLTVEEARAEVAKETGLPDSTLHDHWKKYHRTVRRDLEQQKEDFGGLIPI